MAYFIQFFWKKIFAFWFKEGNYTEFDQNSVYKFFSPHMYKLMIDHSWQIQQNIMALSIKQKDKNCETS